MEPECSLPCCQESTTCPYAAHTLILFNVHFNIILPSIPLLCVTSMVSYEPTTGDNWGYSQMSVLPQHSWSSCLIISVSLSAALAEASHSLLSAVVCTVLNWTELNWTELNWTELNCTVLYCTVLYCTVLYCVVLYWTELNWTELYCTVLYCTV